MKNHEQIPTQIIIKVVNFSTFIDVLHNSKTNVTHAICKLYSMYDDNNLPNVKLLIGSFCKWAYISVRKKGFGEISEALENSE